MSLLDAGFKGHQLKESGPWGWKGWKGIGRSVYILMHHSLLHVLGYDIQRSRLGEGKSCLGTAVMDMIL